MPVSKARSVRQPDILSIAQKNFGYTELRRGQEEAIRALLREQDTLVVMPTGSGKSAVYQIAGFMMDGSALVVSPLIALQKDQVDSINAQDRRKEMAQERLRQMREYADTGSCRREHLLHYFGDDFRGPCQNCDNCEAADPDIVVDASVGTRREVA